MLAVYSIVAHNCFFFFFFWGGGGGGRGCTSKDEAIDRYRSRIRSSIHLSLDVTERYGKVGES